MTTEAHEEELRQRYLADLVATATPVQRLMMLFSYLRRDLSIAADGFEVADWKLVSDHLVHAQHIIFALRDPLDRSTELGANLAGVYDFCLDQLIACNLRKDASLLPEVRNLVDRVVEANAAAAAAPAGAGSGAVAVSA